MPDSFQIPREPSARDAFATRLTHARAWLRARFQRGHGGRLALWIAGGVLGVFAALFIIAASLDWNAFKGPAARMASTMSGRPVAIDGDLRVKLFSFHPEISVSGLRVGNPRWAQAEPPLANVGRAFAQIDLWRTLTGGLALETLQLDRADIHLLKAGPKQANWSGSGGGKPLNLPFIRNFVMRDGQVRYEDRPRGMVLEAAFFSSEAAPGEPDASKRPFHLVGDGQLNGRNFKLDLVGAPLINVRRGQPYAFNAEVHAGATHVVGRGALAKPFDFGAYRAHLEVTGDDLADIFYLTGLALPNTPPYRLGLILTHRANGYDLTEIGGLIGSSDVHGTLHVDRRDDRPYLTGEAHSKLLNFSDLYTVLGAAAPKKAAHAAPQQRIEAQRLAASDRLLPDARLDLKRVRGMDADVKYSAASLKAPGWPLRAFALTIKLDKGLMIFDPLTMDLTQGRLAGAAKLDARADVPDVDLDLKLTGAKLEGLLAASMKDPPVTGALTGRIKLRGQGDTVRKVAATADGQASFVSPHGEIRKALAELTGIDVTKALGLILTKDQSTAPVRCAVADFSIKNGAATPRVLVFDTEDVLITGSGNLNLGDETLDLSLKGQPKEPRLVRLRAPIKLTGHFRSPHVGVDVAAAGAQAGVGAALTALLSPIALVLPFVDAGLAKDADCGALAAQAKASAKKPVGAG